MKRIATRQILESLRQTGWFFAEEELEVVEYLEMSRGLGRVVQQETIALRPGAHAYVAKPGRVPLHTDHPQVDVIGWYCERQDDVDGASLIFDARSFLVRLGDRERQTLRKVELECPPLRGGPPTERWPVLSATQEGDALFCSPWLRAASGRGEEQASLDRFREALSREMATPVQIRLRPGQALFIDNRRVLHGRRAIEENSERRLSRVWLQLPAGALHLNAG